MTSFYALSRDKHPSWFGQLSKSLVVLGRNDKCLKLIKVINEDRQLLEKTCWAASSSVTEGPEFCFRKVMGHYQILTVYSLFICHRGAGVSIWDMCLQNGKMSAFHWEILTGRCLFCHGGARVGILFQWFLFQISSCVTAVHWSTGLSSDCYLILAP